MKTATERGFSMLMARYKEPVYWHIRRLVISHDDAMDATQETFIRVFKSFDQVRDGAAFKAWIYRIATNEALRVIKRPERESLTLDEAQDQAADSYIDYTDLEAVKLQRAIQALPEKQRLTFTMRYYDEMTYDEIAQVIDSSADSAKANYHFAKDKVIKFLNSH